MSSAATTGAPADVEGHANLAHRLIPHQLLEHRLLARTSWDLMLGVILVLTGLFILSDVVLASTLSVLFAGWTLLIGGAIAAVLGVFGMREGDSWAAVLSGAISVVIGLVFVQYPTATLQAFALAVGAVMVSGGIIRMFAVSSASKSASESVSELYLIGSGVLSIVLGLMILNRWPSSALWLIGALLGIQIVADGILLIVLGRPHLSPSE